MRTFPAEPAPASLPESPRRPLQPGKMGQLDALEKSAPEASFGSPSPAAALEPAPAVQPVPAWKRPILLAAVAGAVVVAAAGLAYVKLHKSAPLESVAELSPASEPLDPTKAISTPPDSPQANPQIYTPPPETSSPAMPAPRTPRLKKAPASATPIAADKPKRARKTRPLRAAKQESKQKAEDSESSDRDPLLESLLSNATQSEADPAAKPNQFSLPGLQRPVSASDRAAPSARAPSGAQAATPPIAGLGAPLAEPRKSSPPPGIEDEPAKSSEGDQLALVQVHEQFDFCAQLLTQAAYGDHYDTCLCKDAREAAPHRGRRGFYMTAKKKEAGAGQLETTAKITSSKIDGGVAVVTALWKSGDAAKGRNSSQTWKLEDGLWCQAP